MMSPPNILITGASGYLGGTLLDHLAATGLPPHGTLYALVRNDAQAEAVRKYGAEPLSFDPYDKAAVEKHILAKQISIVFFLIDALKSDAQVHFIEALSKLRQEIEQPVHFLHTSGAKIFSSLAGAPTTEPLFDDDPNLYKLQKDQRAPHAMMRQAVEANNRVIELSEAKGVRSYIFVPCIVYGKGKGFGNAISIQTVAIVKAAIAAKRVYRVDADHPTWPVSHVHDTATLYATILRNILTEDYPGYGTNGYYLASPGSVAWDDLYDAMAKALAKRSVIEDAAVTLADDDALEAMAGGLACPVSFVQVQVGGKCTFTARHGESIGWKPLYLAEHIIEDADAEVELILKHI